MLTGIDVSKYQTTTPPLAGLAFVIARAGFGSGNGPDPMFATHQKNTRAAGLPFGAYWYWYDGQDNAVAVRDFLAIAKDADFLALDLEGPNEDTAIGHAQAKDFIARVHAAGRKIGLYANLGNYPTDLGQDFNWVAYYESVQPNVPWDFWQYSSSTGIDHDKFNGDAAAFASFLADQKEPIMVPALVTDPNPKIATFPAGESVYDLDGTTVLAPKMPAGSYQTGAYSPFAVGALRALYISWTVGKYKLCLAAPSSVKDVPSSGLTQADIDKAVAAQKAADDAALSAAVAKASLAAAQAQYDLDAANVSAFVKGQLANARPG